MKHKILFVLLIFALLTCNLAAAEKIDVYKTDGTKINLVNNNFACDTTYADLMNFLAKNDVDKHGYDYPYYTCANFAEDLHNDAEKEFIRTGIVIISSDENDFYHAFNRFDTVDNGTVFIDCTSAGEDGEADWGDSIVVIGENMPGHTLVSIENPELTSTEELSGEICYEWYW